MDITTELLISGMVFCTCCIVFNLFNSSLKIDRLLEDIKKKKEKK